MIEAVAFGDRFTMDLSGEIYMSPSPHSSAPALDFYYIGNQKWLAQVYNRDTTPLKIIVNGKDVSAKDIIEVSSGDTVQFGLEGQLEEDMGYFQPPYFKNPPARFPTTLTVEDLRAVIEGREKALPVHINKEKLGVITYVLTNNRDGTPLPPSSWRVTLLEFLPYGRVEKRTYSYHRILKMGFSKFLKTREENLSFNKDDKTQTLLDGIRAGNKLTVKVPLDNQKAREVFGQLMSANEDEAVVWVAEVTKDTVTIFNEYGSRKIKVTSPLSQFMRFLSAGSQKNNRADVEISKKELQEVFAGITQTDSDIFESAARAAKAFDNPLDKANFFVIAVPALGEALLKEGKAYEAAQLIGALYAEVLRAEPNEEIGHLDQLAFNTAKNFKWADLEETAAKVRAALLKIFNGSGSWAA